MKTKLLKGALAMLLVTLLQGCVGLPSLVHVEHQHEGNNEQVVRRLDSIEKRLSGLENSSSQP